MSAHPNLRLIMAICSPAVPGAAEAVKQAGKVGKVKGAAKEALAGCVTISTKERFGVVSDGGDGDDDEE
mgnify:CR=1 FL=1